MQAELIQLLKRKPRDADTVKTLCLVVNKYISGILHFGGKTYGVEKSVDGPRVYES